jgi:predicted  nucleic acid-binding Zn-ribbon protein
MADDRQSIDPSAVFANWVTEWERAVDKFSNEVMGTDEFSRSMNQMQKMQLDMQRVFGEAMARQLANFNMPSRDDILELSENIRELDRRVARIEGMIRQLQPAGGNEAPVRRKSPPRTKQPPAAN